MVLKDLDLWHCEWKDNIYLSRSCRKVSPLSRTPKTRQADKVGNGPARAQDRGIAQWSICGSSTKRLLRPRSAWRPPGGEKTIVQLASEYGVHPSQIGRWKAGLREKLPDLFSERRKRADKDREENRGRTLPADRPTQGGAGVA